MEVGGWKFFVFVLTSVIGFHHPVLFVLVVRFHQYIKYMLTLTNRELNYYNIPELKESGSELFATIKYFSESMICKLFLPCIR